MNGPPVHSNETGNRAGSLNNRVGLKARLCRGRPEEPPWKNAISWGEANHTVAFLIERYGNHLHETHGLARNLYGKMVSFFPLLEELCRTTCTYCPDPCCFSAYAWFDFKNLLFAHLNGLAIPPAQLMTDRKMVKKLNCTHSWGLLLFFIPKSCNRRYSPFRTYPKH